MSTGVGALLLAFDVFGCLAQGLGQGALLDLFAEEVLNLLELEDFGLADEGDGYAVAVGTGGAAYAVDVVLGVVGTS